jgi:HSP20 family protein
MVRRTAKFYGPMVELSRLQSELNRLFTDFVEINNRAGRASAWDPSVDVLDDGDRIRVLVELPGMEPEDVRVTLRGKVLTIRGSKKGKVRAREGIRFFCMERYFGSFVKSLSLPRPVNTHQARVVLKNGLLEALLPRVPDQREREYEIKVQGEEE